MKSRNVADFCKDAMGTVFLLAGAFFVCSTFLSIRAVFADPIAPIAQNAVATPQATRAGTSSTRSSARPATSRTNTNIVSRGTTATTVTTAPNSTTPARSVTSRATVSRGATTPTVSRGTVAGTTTTATARPSTTVSRGTPATTGTASRSVVSRNATNTASRVAVNNNRNVISRATTTSGTTPSRVSLQGSAIRGSKSSNTYTYLSNALYTGNYSNIIDSTTGLISAEAYNNCMESYYACMDEICTARNAAQRRCACAGRVKAFAEAEAALETANEELIKVSGELALLIATKGKDVSSAFQLTDAEKVMNCVSWQETVSKSGESSEDAVKWCKDHGIYDGEGNGKAPCTKPDYCSTEGNNFGFDVSSLEGGSSDILASLQAWADAKENTITILTNNDKEVEKSLQNLVGNVSNITGISTDAFGTDGELQDSLAETWGYELFQYAHNNVCNRVLDSCFNGIYEACGTPPSDGRKCGNGQTQCPYNYNSYIKVDNSGTYDLDFIEPNTGYTASNSATCFGYTSASGDPYASLRVPVADARRSIMQKYALDANADCDAYGEQLRTQAQNIGYQKVAAQQALQQKRLEFAMEEEETTLSDAIAAGTNFNECLSEILDCYETQEESQENWSDSRIRTYCAQISNVPHCYETMICNPSTAQFKAVIDVADSATCLNSQDYKKNTCRNIVTLNEILNGAHSNPTSILPEQTGNSAAMREQCLRDNGVEDIRTWSSSQSGTTRCTINEIVAVDKNGKTGVKDSSGTCILTACNSGYSLVDGKCVANATDCTTQIENAESATMTLSGGVWGPCKLVSCKTNYVKTGNECIPATQACHKDTLTLNHATAGTQTWNGSSWGDCVFTGCEAGYTLESGKCIEDSEDSEG